MSFLFLHRHRDRFQGIVAVVAWGGGDLVDYFRASKDFAEDGVGSVQPAVAEVSSAVVLTRRLGHGDGVLLPRP